MFLAGENQKCNDFVDAYIRIHFGEKPEDETAARSDALKSYYRRNGFEPGADEESFILPNVADLPEDERGNE